MKNKAEIQKFLLMIELYCFEDYRAPKICILKWKLYGVNSESSWNLGKISRKKSIFVTKLDIFRKLLVRFQKTQRQSIFYQISRLLINFELNRLIIMEKVSSFANSPLNCCSFVLREKTLHFSKTARWMIFAYAYYFSLVIKLSNGIKHFEWQSNFFKTPS